VWSTSPKTIIGLDCTYKYNYTDDFIAEDYQTPGSHPTDFENPLDIAI
jgi:hypothetical protein